MNPQETFCPNPTCSARGQVGQDNIRVHSLKERRYRCMTCGKTFSETSGTALYGVKESHQDFTRVVTLLGHGCPVQALIVTSQGGSGGINTAFIERLNATFRQCLACLGRRSRALARTLFTLEHGMFLVGCLYNFCLPHASLRLPLYVGRYGRRRWVKRTPAIAAGLTDHIWSVAELLYG